MPIPPRTGWPAVLALLAAVLVVSLAPPTAPAPAVAVGGTLSEPMARATGPDIILVQLDDVSRDLMRTMGAVARMRREGAAFESSYVVDSLCCPSRAAMWTGRAPHHTRVRTNTAGPGPVPTGGWQAYRRAGNPAVSVNLALQEAGYTTGFAGKFLNGYTSDRDDDGVEVSPRVPGWDEFEPVLGSGYRGWGYKVGRRRADGTVAVRTVAKPPASATRRTKDRAYVQSFLERRALDFIRRHRSEQTPYFYTLSTYAAHSRVGGRAYRDDPKFPPAFRDRPRPERPAGNCGAVACSALTVRDLPGFDDPREDNRPVRLVDGRVEPGAHWRPRTRTVPVRALDAQLRDRARMLQSVDRTLTRILEEVRGDDTIVVLTSDNGFHLGQYRFGSGKGTPYRSDSRVPLLAVGPGIEPGARGEVVSNIDLAPTFEDLAGLSASTQPYRDGTSFADELKDAATPDEQRFVFSEHTRDGGGGNPDPDAGTAPSYVAVRGPRGLLVRLDLAPEPDVRRYAWELYTYRTSLYEKANEFRALRGEDWVRDMMRRIREWETCGPRACPALTG